MDGGLELLRFRQERERERQTERSEERREGKRVDKGSSGDFSSYRNRLGATVKDFQAVMATETTSCTGSTLLQPLSDMIDLPLDQVTRHTLS